jgi:hypothetical protein
VETKKKADFIAVESRMVAVKGQEEEGMGTDFSMGTKSQSGRIIFGVLLQSRVTMINNKVWFDIARREDFEYFTTKK